jgi:hypothetical protein
MAEFLAKVALSERCFSSMGELSNISVYYVILRHILSFDYSPDTILTGNVQSREE